jgi:hypothetical protein
MLFINSEKHFLIPVLIVVLTLSRVLNSPVEIVSKESGVVNYNSCQDRILKSYFNDMESDKKRYGWKDDNSVTDICPYLQYTCCTRQQILDLTVPMKKLFSFFRKRESYLLKLISTIQKITSKKFKEFLLDFKEKDIKCYNKIQSTKMNIRMRKFKNNPGILAKLQTESNHMKFNLEVIHDKFDFILNQLDNLKKELENEIESREKYYSSIICTMCSPILRKYFKADNYYNVLYIRQKECNYVLSHDIFNLKINQFIFKIQTLLDLSYCARKNSKPELDYGDGKYSDVYIINFEIDTINENISKRKQCITNINSYRTTSSDSKMNPCSLMCKNSLGIFDIRLRNVGLFMIAENEINHVYLNNSGFGGPVKRLEEERERYISQREPFIQNKHIREVGTGIGNELFTIIRENDDQINYFDHPFLEVELYSGFDLDITQMNKKYFEYSRIFISSFILMAFLLLK